MYMTIRLRMSLIMDLIGPEHYDLSAHYMRLIFFNPHCPMRKYFPQKKTCEVVLL